jgi:hypothetical protein
VGIPVVVVDVDVEDDLLVSSGLVGGCNVELAVVGAALGGDGGGRDGMGNWYGRP